jgi:hypothetical protein
VDEPQIIDSRQIIVRKISLTPSHERVDSHSFFDISKVFPVGGEYRDPSQVTARSESCKRGGRVRIYSEPLVETNRKCFEAQNRSPEALTDLPGWW